MEKDMATNQTFSVMDLAQRSAELRVREAVYGFWSQRHEELVDEISSGMRALAKQHRAEGVDLKTSPFWPLISVAGQLAYQNGYEHGRVVEVDELTPDGIFLCMLRGNTMLFGNAKMFTGGTRETSRDDGVPAYERRVWVSREGHKLELLSGITMSTAYDVYELITGAPHPRPWPKEVAELDDWNDDNLPF